MRPTTGEQLTGLRAKSDVIFDELLARTKQFPQSDDFRRREAEWLETVAVGSERIGQNEGISAVVLGAGGGMSVPEPIDLLGIDGKNGDTALEKGLDHGTVRFFDGRGDVLGMVVGKLHKPFDSGGQAFEAKREASFGPELSTGMKSAKLMLVMP